MPASVEGEQTSFDAKDLDQQAAAGEEEINSLCLASRSYLVLFCCTRVGSFRKPLVKKYRILQEQNQLCARNGES